MGRHRIITPPTPFVRKAAGQMNKIFGLWETGQKRLTAEKRNPPVLSKEGRPNFFVQTEGIDRRHLTRRQIVLNRHFTEILSDVLSIDYKPQLSEIGARITSIETKSWNKGVSIFYILDRPFDKESHDKLNSMITQLRYAVSERRLLGHTPLIQFVYDESAEAERDMFEMLERLDIKKPEEETSLLEQQSQQVTSATKSTSPLRRVEQKYFSAPDDMNNTLFGLDYPALYNEAASKLERGRGISSRMPTHKSLFTTTPLFRDVLKQDVDEEDPGTRVKKILKFVVAQRKKNEHLARVRRKQEILAREHNTWEVPEGVFD